MSGGIDIGRLESEYVREKDWYVRENANVAKAYSSFVGYVYDKIMMSPEVLGHYIPTEYVRMHFDGDIHIHKLPHSLFIPYCNGWMYNKLLRYGLKTPSISTRPAKRLETAISHLVTFLFLASQEFTGAQAMSAVDLFLAPFIGKSNMMYGGVKQATQRLIYELNYPSRLGFQSPFTNITIILDTIKSFLEMDAIVGGKVIGKLGEFFDQAILVARSIFEHFMEGDAEGKPFTFPLVTMMFTKNFDWNGSRWGELTDLIFELISRRGTIYILNGYAINVEALYALCCRLTIDIESLARGPILRVRREEEEDIMEELHKVRETPRAVWAIPDATGSIGVITINLPRIAFLAKDENDFWDLLTERVTVARDILRILRGRYQRSMENGLVPLTRIYLGHYNYHYSTIGLIGLPEMLANISGEPEFWLKNDVSRILDEVRFMARVVREVRKMCIEFSDEEGVLYNVEEVPGESTAYRLASKDLSLAKEKGLNPSIPTLDGVPFYSNSIAPYYAEISLIDRLRIESEVQKEFNGGVMMHIFLGEAADPKALRKLIENIVKNTKIVYFSITPNQTYCNRCGWSAVGVHDHCHNCGSKDIEIWSRIVGYYRPIRNWNIGRRKEFQTRVNYTSAGEIIRVRKPVFIQ